MGYVVDTAAKLAESIKRNRFGSVASLRRAGTPTAQHNVKVTSASPKKTTTKKPAKKASAKKAAPAKKSAAKKSTTKKSVAKKS